MSPTKDSRDPTLAAPGQGKIKRVYKAPCILSEEPLEAVAAVCNPPVGGLGKDFPSLNCPSALGS